MHPAAAGRSRNEARRHPSSSTTQLGRAPVVVFVDLQPLASSRRGHPCRPTPAASQTVALGVTAKGVIR